MVEEKEEVQCRAPAGAGGVAALDHEVLDDPVELGPRVVPPPRQLREVPGGGKCKERK